MLPRHCRTRTNAAAPSFLPSTKRGVPHISLVFREMWDATNLNLFSDLRDKQVKRCGIPHFVEGRKTRWASIQESSEVVRIGEHRDLRFPVYQPRVPGRAPVFFPGWR
jgi:hypothetical protein